MPTLSPLPQTAAALPGSDWLRSLLEACPGSAPGADDPLRGERRDARLALESRGFPGRREEAWRFTDLSLLTSLAPRPLAPDTSPRGDGVANDEAYDMGQGAGFYVDATQKPWAPHFSMETYVTRDLLDVVGANFPVDAGRRGISGHSMGGHGALTLALRHPDLFRSVSAFSPICSPTRCDWGRKAFTGYLGADESQWRDHDAALLIEAGVARRRFDEILVEQGMADGFLENQLKPELLEAAAAKAGQRLTVRRQPGYDHSYFFIASFIDDHLRHHAAALVA
jgi:S-formylglutathione hydrolase